MTNLLQPVINDLREKRLWPVVIVLIVGLIAVPVLLAKPAPKPHPAIAAPNPVIGAGRTTGTPVVALSSTPQFSHLPGHGRDPFTQQQQRITTITTTTSSPALGTPSASSSSGGANVVIGSHGSSSSFGSGAGGGGTSTPVPSTPAQTNPGLPTPPVVIPPKPAGLTPTESYDVTIAITKPAGGLDTIDPLKRLTPLPSNAQPLLIELGVLKGGSRVLFVVQPGTVLSGPARCLPGKIDCQLISLGLNQIESLYVKGASGSTHVSDFAVTGVNAVSHKSTAAAGRARRQVSKVGQRLLHAAHYDALSLFPYKTSVGAVVDQRNVNAGGS